MRRGMAGGGWVCPFAVGCALAFGPSRMEPELLLACGYLTCPNDLYSTLSTAHGKWYEYNE